MTMPYERTRAVINAQDFLLKILLPPGAGGFAGIPKAVRQEARWVLKHYPMPCEIPLPQSWDAQEVARYYAAQDAHAVSHPEEKNTP